jgi:hypothetical protein
VTGAEGKRLTYKQPASISYFPVKK